jgi:hypothetical protein
MRLVRTQQPKHYWDVNLEYSEYNDSKEVDYSILEARVDSKDTNKPLRY